MDSYTAQTKRMIHLPIAAPQPPETDLKQWIPLTSLEQMSETVYDVLIVGAGAAGPAVLWRLCQQWVANPNPNTRGPLKFSH